ncbi:WxL domain-containing protein [Enterococcus gilvus]|uniref:WxL domain-containing protein n=1 Tax=Enterococcus gilvus TaxID=160453 RepID=UPI001C8C80AB|nr:WxL domain-containing protein [Enterococcus gilvus]MBX8936949.1 hypothetical protein [Enterococcus gilvus]
MNKKKLVTGLLSTAFLGGVLVTTALPADAATYSIQSNGSISFKSGSLELPPPGPDIDGPSHTGDFGLLYVPEEFNFAETTVPSTAVTGITKVPIDKNWEGSPAAKVPTGTPLAGSNPEIKRFAVGDVRGERKAGWRLDAKLTTNLTTGTKDLTGATITMNQELYKLTPQTAPTPWLQQATTASADANTPDYVPGTVGSSTVVTLSAAASTTVMSAAKETNPGDADGRGEGYWKGELTNIELNIPAAAMNAATAGEQYKGTVDWTLTDSI